MKTRTEAPAEPRSSTEARAAAPTPKRPPGKPAETVTAYDEIWFDRRPLH